MLTALLEILKFVIAAAKKTPDQKRQQLAKGLYKVYVDIDDVVERGRKLLTLFGTQTVVASVAIEALLEQQAALNSLTIHLRKVEAVLEIHLPRTTATLHVATQFKGAKIVFILDWLLNSPDPQRGPEMYLPVGYSEMTSMVRRFLLSEHLPSDEVPLLDEPSSDLLNPWEWFFQGPINSNEWTDEQLQYPTFLLATSDDFRKAEDTLDSLAAIAE